MSKYDSLERAVIALGFRGINPESLTALEPKLGEHDHYVRREYREFMWDMGRMFADRDESEAQRYWQYVCYAKQKGEDLVAVMTDELDNDLARQIGTHIAMDIISRARGL